MRNFGFVNAEHFFANKATFRRMLSLLVLLFLAVGTGLLLASVAHFGGLTFAVIGLCLLLTTPAHVQNGLQDAGQQNGCGYRVHLSGTHWVTPYIVNFTKDAKPEAWLHPDTSVLHSVHFGSLIHVIRPNGFFARAQHDWFFTNTVPFDRKQVVVILAVQFPIFELVKMAASDLVRELKQRCGLFPHVTSFAGYMVNQRSA